MPYPSLGDWNEKKPVDAEDDAVIVAERLAWTAVDMLTAGRLAFVSVTVRPIVLEDDGTVLLPIPAGEITRVRINGADFNAWRAEGARLFRMDGDTWPINTEMGLAAGATGTFEVTYYPGYRPGRLLVWATAELAAEFYAAASGKKCRLPKNVTAITRQGVSFEMAAPIFDNGRTGIHEIDVILSRYNPLRQRSLPAIVSPETLARAPRRY